MVLCRVALRRRQEECWPRWNAQVLVMVNKPGLSRFRLGRHLTGFLLWEEGGQDECFVNSFHIERHTRCAAYVVRPNLFVLCWKVVDANMWGGAGVKLVCNSSAEECGEESFSMAFRQGHETVCGIDDIPCVWMLVPVSAGPWLLHGGHGQLGYGEWFCVFVVMSSDLMPPRCLAPCPGGFKTSFRRFAVANICHCCAFVFGLSRGRVL